MVSLGKRALTSIGRILRRQLGAAYQSARLPQGAYFANAQPFVSGNDVAHTSCVISHICSSVNVAGAVRIAGVRSGVAGSYIAVFTIYAQAHQK